MLNLGYHVPVLVPGFGIGGGEVGAVNVRGSDLF